MLCVAMGGRPKKGLVLLKGFHCITVDLGQNAGCDPAIGGT